VLLGHIDTVPGVVPVRIVDGRLYGRGAVDAKGALATFVMAAARAALPAGTRVVVIGAVEEESATSKGARFAATQYRPNWCVIGEPSGWDGVTLGYKGRVLIDYDLSLPVSHTAGPEISAAEQGVTFWQEIREYATRFNESRARLFDQLLPTLRHIQTRHDGLTESVTARISLRLPPDFDLDDFIGRLQVWAGAATCHWHSHEAAFQSDRRTPLARELGVAIRRAGRVPRFKLKTGTADMNVVGPIWQCPIVAYGPGDSRLDHTPDEHILLADLLQAIPILQTLLEIPH
jgi:LysW-gamma-L-lysine carboxypeptidase